MVRDKRTAIQLVAPPIDVGDDQEVWCIEQTGEWFISYEAYLHRLDYYNQKRFKDEVSSRSNLTFFAAYRAERDGQQAIDADFPSVLRGPILHKAQFSTISRLDELVDSLYNTYKDNIIPGEEVYVLEGKNGTRSEGIVSDKTMFAATKDMPAMSRIFVRLPTSPDEQAQVALVDQDHIRRKPKAFTKYNLTRFLRTSLEREPYDGAPWTVKVHYATKYGIDTTVPNHLTRDALQAKKALLPKKIRSYNGIPAHWTMKNGLIVPKTGHVPSQEELDYLHARYHFAPIDVQKALLEEKPGRRRASKQEMQERRIAAPVPPPVKYPIEDLQLDPKSKDPQRPALKEFTTLQPFPDPVESADLGSVDMKFVGPLLAIWDTLQVFSGYFRLDGMTIDDLYGAMLVTSDSIPCQLFDEVHCAILKLLFEVKNKDTQEMGELGSKTLNDAAEAKKNETSSTSTSGTSSPTTLGVQEMSLGSRTDRDVEMSDAPQTPLPSHRAAEMAGDDVWSGKIMRFEFPRGGWQLIMVGVLEQLSHLPRYRSSCNRILEHLAPNGLAANQQTAKTQYDSMDVNLRIEALQIITTLTFETKSFKAEMNQLMTDATETRKNKVERQSERKTLIKNLDLLQAERRRLRPDNDSASADPETRSGSVDEEGASAEGSDREDQDSNDENSANEDENASDPAGSDNENSTINDADRRVSGRTALLKRKREEEDERERMQLDAKNENDHVKMMEAIKSARKRIAVCEEEIASLDGDLRENACHRTKLLGVDRFFNRYIWFERNGMPFAGDEESSAYYGYANGRLWVQGGDALDREGIVHLNELDEQVHVARFGMTMQERRDREEGPTQLANADQWGYIDTETDFYALLQWLKEKGEREKRLKRELVAYRIEITDSMTAMQTRLADIARKYDEFEDRPQRGVALRKRTGGEASEADKVRYPCLAWRNSWMQETFGHLHCDGAEAVAAGLAWAGKTKRTRGAGRATKGREKERSASEVPERRTTRQGTKFAR